MRTIATLFVASTLALGGCNLTSKIDKTNVVIKNASESAQLDKVCKGRPIIVGLFDLLRSQVTIPDSITSKVYLASAGVKRICDDRPTDITSALKTATALYNEILASQTEVNTAIAAKLGE